MLQILPLADDLILPQAKQDLLFQQNRPAAVSRIFRGRFALHLSLPKADTLRRSHPEGIIDTIERRIMKDYLDKKKLLIRQGHQLWNLHNALLENPEEVVIGEMANVYKEVGRVKTIAEGMVLAGANITAYRSTEEGERVMQRTRNNLKTRPKGDPLLA
ncbi:hypothetical protein [Pseudomonas viridiflava]|uniref:hypothetical protein n=1 Tax=Pseudomonas viridiflava TaxID=33069 RepID=UPI0013C32F2D|nr:hypothetical protein [Pseudomonas viridiflava]